MSELGAQKIRIRAQSIAPVGSRRRASRRSATLREVTSAALAWPTPPNRRRKRAYMALGRLQRMTSGSVESALTSAACSLRKWRLLSVLTSTELLVRLLGPRKLMRFLTGVIWSEPYMTRLAIGASGGISQ